MKQRVVGAVVLTALAVVFVPILLDGQGITNNDLPSEIPIPPAVVNIPDIVPSRPVIIADTEEVKVVSTAAEHEELTLALDDEGLPLAWSVRLGTFSQKENADALLSRLLAAKYKAYSREIQSSQGLLTAIFIGPKLDESLAQELRVQLENEFDLSGIVTRFTLEKDATKLQ